MAAKKYGYYLEGNKIALVEKDIAFDNNDGSRDFGPGSQYSQWKSPITDVSDGLELRYTYAPTYVINDADETKAVTTYSESGGNLVLTIASITIAADAWILITGSDRWNGLHQVKNAAGGVTSLTLKTKYNGDLVEDALTVSTDITVMTDESFELDLPIYLQKAVVYFIKAKMFEDMGDLKGREYFYSNFLKQVERHNNGRTTGLRIVAPGGNSII